MLEIFVGKHLIKINRLQAILPPPHEPMLMHDTLLFTFKDGTQYQIHTDQPDIKLIPVFSPADFYTNWEMEEDEQIEIVHPCLQKINATITELIEVEVGGQWFSGFMLKFDDHEPVYVDFIVDEMNIVDHDWFYSYTQGDWLKLD